MLACFAGGVDLLHSMLRDHPVRYVLALIEDGGEMIAMSVIAAAAWAEAFIGRASARAEPLSRAP